MNINLMLNSYKTMMVINARALFGAKNQVEGAYVNVHVPVNIHVHVRILQE